MTNGLRPILRMAARLASSRRSGAGAVGEARLRSMRYLEVRRHGFTKKGDARGRGSHLSREGVPVARVVGEAIGPIAYVATSESPRTLETAVAMGFAVDDILAFGSRYATGGVADHEQWAWEQPYRTYRQLLSGGGLLAAAATEELELWRAVLARIEDQQTALIVSHGGSIEPTLVAACPDAQVETWGRPFSHLDGVTLTFEADRCIAIDWRRYAGTSGPQTS
jgi:broad specificity phosphatase PhoE